MTTPASVRKIAIGVYVVIGVGDHPQRKPSTAMTIRRHSKADWRVEFRGTEREMRWHSLRAARYDASTIDSTKHVQVTTETVTERDIEVLLRSSPDEAVQRLAGAALDKRTDPRFLPDLRLRVADAINARAANGRQP